MFAGRTKESPFFRAESMSTLQSLNNSLNSHKFSCVQIKKGEDQDPMMVNIVMVGAGGIARTHGSSLMHIPGANEVISL